MQNFAKEKFDFGELWSDLNLANEVLNNKKISSDEDKIFVYAKLKTLMKKCKDCTYEDRLSFYENKKEVEELIECVRCLEASALQCKILYLKKEQDKKEAEIKKKIEADAERTAYDREIARLREERKTQVALREAAETASKFKFKCVADTVKEVANYKINKSEEE